MNGPAAAVRAPLREIAHARAGDKGDWATISLIAYAPSAYGVLVREATAERVRDRFAHRNPREVRRYELPKLGALNFVLVEALEGGVNGSLNLDGHGKTLSFHLLGMEVEMEREVLAAARAARARLAPPPARG